MRVTPAGHDSAGTQSAGSPLHTSFLPALGMPSWRSCALPSARLAPTATSTSPLAVPTTTASSWVASPTVTIADRRSAAGYRENMTPQESLSMWQSLSFAANYKTAYCLAVCRRARMSSDRCSITARSFLMELYGRFRKRRKPSTYSPTPTPKRTLQRRFPHKRTKRVHNGLHYVHRPLPRRNAADLRTATLRWPDRDPAFHIHRQRVGTRDVDHPRPDLAGPRGTPRECPGRRDRRQCHLAEVSLGRSEPGLGAAAQKDTPEGLASGAACFPRWNAINLRTLRRLSGQADFSVAALAVESARTASATCCPISTVLTDACPEAARSRVR